MEEDDGIPFADKMATLTSQLKTQFEENEKLEAQIKQNLAGLGYEILKSTPLRNYLSNIVDNRGRTCPTAEEGIPLIATNCIRNQQLYPSYENNPLSITRYL